jgi:alpha-amylase
MWAYRKRAIACLAFFLVVVLVACGGSAEKAPGDADSGDADTLNKVTINFLRADKNYEGWGLHLWGDALDAETRTTWASPKLHDRIEDGAAVFEVPYINDAEYLKFIVHLDDLKSPDVDLGFVPSAFGTQVWVVQDSLAGFDSENNIGIPFDNRAEAETALAELGTKSAQLDLSPVTQENSDTGLANDWTDRASFMEIYVRGYQDSDGDGIGDFQGLISRLDYLKELGVNALWLMPITKSSDRDHGYAVVDYRQVEPDYGTLADFEQLLDEAHARGMGIIIDYVINHSSSRNPLFLDAASTPDNDKRDWYLWSASKPEGWSGYGGDPWHNAGNGWYYGVFTSSMPDFNLDNPEVVAYHESNLRFWLNKGVDGFRFDAVGSLFENGYDAWEDQPENHVFMNQMKTLIESYDKRFIVCESPGGFSEFASADSCGRAFNFAGAWLILESARKGRIETGLVSELSSENIDSTPLILGNHDAFAGQRVWNEVSGDLQTYRLAAATYLLGASTPFTYYGEEIGLAQAVGLEGDAALRTPMSWTSNPDTAGFTTGTPFRELSENLGTHNVEAQLADNESLAHHYRQLYQLRNDYPLIVTGSLEVHSSDSDPVLLLVRRQDAQAVVVAINYSSSSQYPELASGLPDTSFQGIHGTSAMHTSDGSGRLNLTLMPQEIQVLISQ